MKAPLPSITDFRKQMRASGLRPIPVYGKKPVLDEWQNKLNTNDDEIELWEKDYPDARNTGLLTRNMPTLDVDILNQDASEAVEALVRARFADRGAILVRIGLAPKRAIPFRTDKPFDKIRVRLLAADGAPDQKIELLADGQQVVGFGTHPDTGKPYKWHVAGKTALRLEELPLITEAEAQELVDDAVKLLTEQFGYTHAEDTHKGKANGKFNGVYPPATRAEIKAALDVTPSDDYEIWYQVGCALCNEFGNDGWALFEPWSKKSEKYNASQCAKQWEACAKKVAKGSGYGAGTIKHYANLVKSDWRAATAEKVKPGNLIQSSGEFVQDFMPPDYLIDGLLQRRYLYSLTGPTGSGKTCLALLIAAHVALGSSLDGREIEKARVLFFAGENPDDVRMRWIKLCEEMGHDPETMDVIFLPGTPDITNEQIRKRIDAEVEKHGPIGLLIVDTSAAYFRGDDENSNAQLGNHARMLRSFINLPGGPTILVTAHPLKTPNMENLVPRGGGAFLNEVDGNLVAIKQDAVVQLHWHGKFRGPDFAPIPFKLTPGTTEKLKDKKGQPIWTITAAPISEVDQTRLEDVGRAHQNELLLILQKQSDLSLAQMAETADWYYRDGKPNKSLVNRVLKTLEKEKLIHKSRGYYFLTKTGAAEVKTVKAAAAKRPTVGSRKKIR